MFENIEEIDRFSPEEFSDDDTEMAPDKKGIQQAKIDEWVEALMNEYETTDNTEGHKVQLVKLKGGKTRLKFDLPTKECNEQFTKGFGSGG